jgi:hypothetical protein
MHSFSHEIYREVVYDKYICSRDNQIRWHQLMARYFSQLETGPRKLVALPYHLEQAGTWSKVKNCLTDIKMFRLWWTPSFKADFMKFWAQLTRVNKKEADTDGHGKREPTRPTYDIVEEYVKSLDEYRNKEHPSDEAVSSTILLIADFLLEFAMTGHEQHADVPNIIHPYIPSADLESIGVPHLKVDDQGRSVLRYPDVYSNLGGRREGTDPAEPPQDQGGKAIDDIPYCTTYFFHRWMWIQFPYIALGNCDSRYVEGEEKKKINFHGAAFLAQEAEKKRREEEERAKQRAANAAGGEDKSGLLDTNKFKLPEITFNRKAARTLRRVPLEGDASADKFAIRMQALQDDIQNLREEYDFVMQMKSGLRKRLAELSGSLETLKRSAESVHQFDDAMQDAIARDADALKKKESVELLNRNLKQLSIMCDRHPPNVPALILEIEKKIAQDKFLLEEIKVRLWEQKFERLMHGSNYKIMQFLSRKGENMHNQLLECRISMKVALTNQATEMDRAREKKLRDEQKKLAKKEKFSGSLITNSTGAEESESGSGLVPGQTWAEMWNIITTRTGIEEPHVFFERLRNGSGLTDQIGSLRRQAEARLDSLKVEAAAVEEDMEATRLSTMNGGSDDTDKEQRLKLVADEKYLKIIKEKAETQEQLETTVKGGLGHLGELLGVPMRHEDAISVADLLRDIESMVDVMMDEREKIQQSNAAATNGNGEASSTSRVLTRDGTTGLLSPDVNNRPPELDAVLQRFEAPKLRLPHKLPSRPILDAAETPSERDEEEDDEEGMWDRNFALTQTLKFQKMKKQKEAAAAAAPAKVGK